ncbi:MAG: hypothetical protein ACYCTE_08785, partial [Acidimicrobiales bacterium]
MAGRTTGRGLYDARREHDACGVAFVADIVRGPSHEIVDLGLTALENLAHRGAFGADPETGDGAGILLQMPDELFRAVAGIELPPRGAYASGMAFLPAGEDAAAEARAQVAQVAAGEDVAVLGWRDVP